MENENRQAPKVRVARESDAAVVHALAGELAAVVGDTPPPEKAVGARLIELLEGKSSGVMVAEVGDEVAGVVSYWLKPDLAHGDAVVEIPMLAVFPRHRRGGVGKALLAAVTEEVGEASIVELVVVPTNLEAREFYASLGFVETDHLVLEFVGDVEDFPENMG